MIILTNTIPKPTVIVSPTTEKIEHRVTLLHQVKTNSNEIIDSIISYHFVASDTTLLSFNSFI